MERSSMGITLTTCQPADDQRPLVSAKASCAECLAASASERLRVTRNGTTKAMLFVSIVVAQVPRHDRGETGSQ